MQVNCDCSQCMVTELNRKWILAEIKVSLIQVAHDLLQDDIYTRKAAARTLFTVIQKLEHEERVL